MKKICVVVGSRANYSSIKSAMLAIKNHPKLELQLVLGASALLDRYGSVEQLIEKDGFHPSARLYMLIEGETPLTMAKSTGLGLIEMPTLLGQLNPDIVLTVGDRFETMATTLAAAYMNFPIAHTMGGEVSGTIDESIRHAVTKFAHLHFPASKDAHDRIVKLGEDPECVHLVGCPRIDLVKDTLSTPFELSWETIGEVGVGEHFDLREPFALVSQHPVTTEFGDGEKQINATLEAIHDLKLPAIVLWPNADAGSENMAAGIRKWREKKLDRRMRFFKNLPVQTYVRLMSKAACLIGNSSSGIREGAFIGTPVVNIGTRQTGRERGSNVIDVGYLKNEIRQGIELQLSKGKYPMAPIYGDGNAGKKIAEVLSTTNVKIQKRITY
jgi:UDP-hydrolysing UDP-N-acetyl-D-glucosamine 2-epimerase